MTFERWLIIGLLGGLVAANLLLLVLVYLTKENKEERYRCEMNERERARLSGWNSALRCMEADEHNYCPKEAKAGET